MNGIFLDLTNEEFFKKYVTERFCRTPEFVSQWFNCENTVDSDRVAYAHKQYLQNTAEFSVLLHSKNPDQYKRAGALLHALYRSNVITATNLVNGVYGTPDDLESGFTMVSHGDAQHVLKFARFYQEYHNEVFSFDAAYRCCAAYEPNPRPYDFDYLQNMSRYLKMNSNLALDTFFMMFKSLMA